MKKLLYLLFAFTLFISCGSDNDVDIDPIIGTWQLTSETENEIEISTECSRKNTFIFLENGTVSLVSYEDNDNATCDMYTNSANWENAGDSNYKIGNVSETTKLIFSENNTVFSVSSKEEFNGTIETTTESYKKI
jgi:hypothetical protein